MSTPEAQQPQRSDVPAAAAALTAAGLGYADVRSASIPVHGAAALAKGAAEAHAAVLKGVSSRILREARALLESRYPEDADRVPLGELEERARAFEAASAARVRAGVREAARLPTRGKLLADLDRRLRSVSDPAERAKLEAARVAAASAPGPREAATRRVMARESRLAEEHARAQIARVYGRAQQVQLERTSPRGALWKLGEARDHTRDCVMAAGVVFPHSVLREWSPPVHVGCQCRLVGIQDAIRLGYLGASEVTSPAAAIRIARDAQALSEAQADALLILEELRSRGALREHSLWDEFEHPRNPLGRFRETGIPSFHGRGLKLGKPAGGSNGARWATRVGSSKPWLVKAYRGDRDRIATELLANAVYREMGAAVPVAGRTHVSPEPDFRKVPDVPTDEPKMISLRPGDTPSAGMVVFEPDGRVWSFEPKDHYGGYARSFPKGGLESGMSVQQNAHRELFEETGLRARVVGWVGDYPGTTSTTRFYAAVRTGGEPVPGEEAAAVHVGSPQDTLDALNAPRDRQVLADALKLPRPVVPPDPVPERSPALTYEALDGSPRPYYFQEGGEPSAELGAHFMTDALLANWDVAGLEDDNVLWSPDGVPQRVDQGGTLEFRAQGAPKPFGPVPLEVASMLKPPGQAARSMAVTDAGLRQQAAEIEDRLTPARVDELVDAAGFADEAMRERVRKNLKARIEWMGRFARGEVEGPLVESGSLAEALAPSVFSWDPHLHPRDQYGKFRHTIFGLLPGHSLSFGDKLKVVREKQGTWRVYQYGKSAKGFRSATDTARYALDLSARSRLPGSVGGAKAFKDLNDVLDQGGFDSRDPLSFGGEKLSSVAEYDKVIAGLDLRLAAMKKSALSDVSVDSAARAIDLVGARLAEAEEKRAMLAKEVGKPSPSGTPEHVTGGAVNSADNAAERRAFLASKLSPTVGMVTSTALDSGQVFTVEGSAALLMKGDDGAVFDLQSATLVTDLDGVSVTAATSASKDVQAAAGALIGYAMTHGPQGPAVKLGDEIPVKDAATKVPEGAEVVLAYPGEPWGSMHFVSLGGDQFYAAQSSPPTAGTLPPFAKMKIVSMPNGDSSAAPAAPLFKQKQENTLGPLGSGLPLKQLALAPGDKIQYKKGGWSYTVQEVKPDGSLIVAAPNGKVKQYSGFKPAQFVTKADGSKLALKGGTGTGSGWSPPAVPKLVRDLPVGGTWTFLGTTFRVVTNEGPGGEFAWASGSTAHKGKWEMVGLGLLADYQAFTLPDGASAQALDTKAADSAQAAQAQAVLGPPPQFGGALGDEEAREHLRARQDQAHLSPIQESAVGSYTGDSTAINKAMRDSVHPVNLSIAEKVKYMDEAMVATVTKRTQIVRKTDLPEWTSAVDGQVIHDNGFFSASWDPHAISTGGVFGSDAAPVEVHVLLNPGDHFVYPNAFGKGLGEEREVILPRGTQFHILKRTTKGSVVVLYVEPF